jgi:positive regulator of sigma E activity
MRDKGLVINTNKDMAQVELQCLIESCRGCAARGLCTGQGQSKSLLTVRNPVDASPGDEVEVEIPETQYSRALIILFGSLLIASLLGLGLGSLLSPLLALSSSVSSLLGVLVALIIAGAVLSRYFRAKNKASFYPLIIAVTKKAAHNL